ncbi:FIG00554498: hypothetical protein [Cronobacter condimenti 1330]|uniref:Uncharacterized protein n=1 Tax=Cronobacter condimenti 1330 TaxID=1073999 RepID=K7ZZ97_9ENTR|nr:hypothetical protein [Cronobacter condimenti]CCJ71550.1 FIG00554498: hypothetical protein [Cronobacter condimenti 1330]
MWDKSTSVTYINSHVEPGSLGKCATYVRKAVEAGGVKIKIPPPRIGNSASACDYGPSLEKVGFKPVYVYSGSGPTDTAIIPGQQTGDVVVIQPIDDHPHGHIALFNGVSWVSDFIQTVGFYPGQQYRNVKPAYKLYRYSDNDSAAQNAAETQKGKIKIVWPIPSDSRGNEFSNQEDILSHLAGESTGQYTIGRSGMWHGGIHITEATTPWCALSGKAPLEVMDFPVPFKGEQAIRCMADGEVVAYRVCKDYLTLGWESGPLSFSGSFVLVKHYIQPGEKETSGLHFYTLYMHLAPYSAYQSARNVHWITQDALSGYSEADWIIMDLSRSDQKPVSAGTVKKGITVTWDPTNTALTSTNNGRTYGLATLNADSGNLKSGQKVWMLVDNNNIKPAPGSGPTWWEHLMPPAKQAMEFDKTVSLTAPFVIKAGDPVGHMGYYQAPKDGSYEARYQVHIECTSMDDNLEKFLTNPDKVGEKNPQWLKYDPGLALFTKDVSKGTFTKGAASTTRTGILPLSKVTTEIDKSTKQEYWQLRPENAYVPKGQAEPQLLSQYDLAKLGFRTETSEPTSFDYLDGKNQPTGFFRSLINSLYEAATSDTRTSHVLVKHNYQRLLDKIDSGSDNYSPMEYWRALHNPDYCDVIQKTIVKHPSDWYFKKGDVIWQPFLDALKREAPEWKKYSEDFLDKMAWMQDVTTEKLGPSLWHMHPIMLLGALIPPGQVEMNFTIENAKDALRVIFKEHGYETAVIIERLYRDETKHFKSVQYKRCGTGGMEVSGRNPQPPGYGWDASIYNKNPEYTPLGVWWSFENKGMSGQGGNKQVTDRKKGYIIFPSVLAAMEYKVDYIKRHDGNWAIWHSRSAAEQENYRKYISTVRHPFSDELLRGDIK